MDDNRNPEKLVNEASKNVYRRNFVTGSLAAGASLAVGATAWKVWSQAGPPMPIIPIECVPPVPFGQANAFAPAGGPVRIRKSVFELDAAEIARLKAELDAMDRPAAPKRRKCKAA